ncbi:MAG: response regulator [bacterium]|nr:response regulator [bacterium]
MYGKKSLDVLKNISLLFVEDDREIREQISQFLDRRLGTCYTAENGVEGLEVLKDKDVDVVITDIRMPVMDGLKMAAAIKEIDPDMPIGVTTAYNESEFLIKAIEIGIDKYLLKPIDTDILVAFLTDIARRKQSYAFLRGMEKLADGIVVFDKDRKITIINPTAERMLGLKKHDLFTFDILPLLNNDRKKMVNITLSNGQRGVGEISAAEIEWEGKPVFIVSAWDITRHIEGKAVAAGKFLFLRTMWHELLTPLNPIIGFANMLAEEQSMSKEQKEYASFISASGRELLNMVNSILMLSDISMGERELEYESIDMLKLLETGVQMVKDQIKDHYQVTTSISSTFIEADCRLVKQVIFHLLTNACKFSPEGGEIHLKAFQKEEEVIISVSDTGIGIPIQHQEKIFDAFWRVDGGYEREYSGAGIGLHLTKQIVEKHGGRIWVDSEAGKGSCFSVAFPLKKPPASVDEMTGDGDESEEKRARKGEQGGKSNVET